ncbi:MAG: DUF1611 domain-containing protein [candidate division Zixibacteria bacterium]|nr:DUF1611 domain-containing protein [candidate division Zixibacteria bacterium]MCK4427282.1 DUF1611 domain-containing protein [candidate division Zixibacteria bacterium]
MSDKKRRIAILSEGYFGDLEAKTASGLIMYRPEEVVAVIDSTKAGQSVQEILGFGGDIPIVEDLDTSLKYSPNALLIGIAPRGGKLPSEWRNQVKRALENGLDVISGLHDMLNEDSELSMIALLKGAKIWDLREAKGFNKVAIGDPNLIEAKVVLTVGTDCKVGKMITAIEIAKEAKNWGWNPFFAATGQTGMVIADSGVPIDSIIGDFMSGALEEFLIEKSKSYDLLLVEGQGTLIHPGYSGVSLALIHGSLPDAMVLCHFPGRKKLKNYNISIPPLPELIKLHEEVAKPVKSCKVIAICLNTQELSEKEAKEEIKKIEAETHLPTTDPIRFGCKKLVEALEFLKN